MGALLASGVFAYASAGSSSESSLSSVLRPLGAKAKYPDAVDDTATVDEDSVANAIDVLANDETHPKRTTTIVSVTQGSHGSVAISFGGDLVLYSPVADYFGGDSFNYTIFDGKFADTATVSVTVNSVNDSPVAVNDVASGVRGTQLVIDVLANDSTGPDPGETLSVVSVTQGDSGSVSIAKDGATITYLPGEFAYEDTFGYTLGDGNGGTASALVKVALNPDDDPTGGAIEGNVTGPAGGPIYGVHVTASSSNGNDWGHAFTDTAGFYRIPALTAGDYTVGFTPSQGDNFVAEFYNDIRDYSAADLVGVQSEVTTSGIDAALSVGGVIKGTVTDSSGSPIEGIWVFADGTIAQAGFAKTDASGGYDLVGLWTDEYVIYFSPKSVEGFDPPVGNYLREYYNDTRDPATAERIPVEEGFAVSGIDASLAPGGVIAGIVIDEGGNPLEGIEVSPVWGGYSVPTDPAGAYRLEALETGEYKVSFDPPFDSNYISEWYDDKQDFESADHVPVVAGAVTDGINAALSLGGIVEGRVTDPSGNPLSGVHVSAFSEQGSGWAITDPHANYSVRALRTGAYRIRFLPAFGTNFLEEYWNDKQSFSEADLVEVTQGSTVSSVNAALEIGGVISGSVTDEAGNPLASVWVSASGDDYASQGTDSDGKFSLVGLKTGQYRVQFSPPFGGDYISEFYNDKADFSSADLVAVTAGQETPGIDASLTLGGQITGRVTDEAGNPLSGVHVSASSGASFASATTDLNGDYSIRALRGGDYRIRFFPPFDSDYIGEFYNDKADFFSADLVSVTTGEVTAGIDASLALAGRIGGRVTDSAGVPLPYASVRAFSVSPPNSAFASTDIDGNYTVRGLRAGSYKVEFRPPFEANFVSEFYNDKPDALSADTVDVTVGETTYEINASLEPGGIIEGRVTDSSGNPLSNVSVQITKASQWVTVVWAFTDESGEYRAVGLRTGEYKVNFSKFDFVQQWYYTKAGFINADIIQVTAPETSSGIGAVLMRVGEFITGPDSYSGAEDSTLTVGAPGVLANDQGGPPLSASLYSNPSKGTVVLNSDGSFSYTPFSDFNGSDSFSYRATDGTNFSDPVTVSLSIAAVNDPPSFTGGPDVVVDEDAGAQNFSAWATNISAGPADEAAQGLVFQVETDNPSLFSAAPAIDPAFGHLSFTSAQNAYGGANVTVVLRDGGGVENGGADVSATHTFTITVNPVNDAPIVMNDSALTPEDTPVVIEVLANDYDVEGDPLTVTIVAGPGIGEALVNPDGTVTYTPPPDEYGSDTFIYEVSDGNGGTATADVWVEIVSVNDTPQAEDDAASTDEDSPVILNVLANDSGLGDAKMNGPLTLALLSGPSNGSVALDSEGVVGPSPSGFVGNATYTPAPDFNGSDGFVYSVTDPDGETSSATVTITVLSVNDPPVAVDDSVSTDEDTPVTADVLANDYDVDGDPLQVSISAGPGRGAAVVDLDGSITYTPDPDYNGSDSLTYSISDPSGAAASAILSIAVTPVNDSPVAGDDSAETEHFTPVTVYVLANDFDVDGDTLTVALVSGPSNGTVSCTPDGYCTYSPNFLFLGFDSFIYQVSDGNGGTDTAKVTIIVGLPSLPSPPKPPYLPPPY